MIHAETIKKPIMRDILQDNKPRLYKKLKGGVEAVKMDKKRQNQMQFMNLES